MEVDRDWSAAYIFTWLQGCYVGLQFCNLPLTPHELLQEMLLCSCMPSALGCQNVLRQHRHLISLPILLQVAVMLCRGWHAM